VAHRWPAAVATLSSLLSGEVMTLKCIQRRCEGVTFANTGRVVVTCACRHGLAHEQGSTWSRMNSIFTCRMVSVVAIFFHCAVQAM